MSFLTDPEEYEHPEVHHLSLKDVFQLVFVFPEDTETTINDTDAEFAIEKAVECLELLQQACEETSDDDELVSNELVERLIDLAELQHTLFAPAHDATHPALQGPPRGARRPRRHTRFPVTRRLLSLLTVPVYSVFAYYAVFTNKRKALARVVDYLNPGNTADLLHPANVITAVPARIQAVADTLRAHNHTTTYSLVSCINSAIFVDVNITSLNFTPGLFWKHSTLVQRYTATGDASMHGYWLNSTNAVALRYNILLPYAEFYASQRLQAEAAYLTLPTVSRLLLKLVYASARFAALAMKDTALNNPVTAASLLIGAGAYAFYCRERGERLFIGNEEEEG